MDFSRNRHFILFPFIFEIIEIEFKILFLFIN